MSGTAGTIGAYYGRVGGGAGNSGANSIYLTKFLTRDRAIKGVTAGSIALQGGTFKFKQVVYADSGGSPTTLLGVSNEVVNPTPSTMHFHATTFATPFDLPDNGAVWIGYVTDVGFQISIGSGGSGNTPPSSYGPRFGGSNTYTAGPPSTLVGYSPSFTGDGNCIPDQTLSGNYAILLFGEPELTPAFLANITTGGNSVYVQQYTALNNLSSVATGHIRCFKQAYSGANVRMVVYSDSSNTPDSLLATSNQVAGMTTSDNVFTFPSPFNITSGTKYWIGWIADTGFTLWSIGAGSVGFQQIGTPYSSGPPATFGGSGASIITTDLWLENGSGGSLPPPIGLSQFVQVCS